MTQRLEKLLRFQTAIVLTLSSLGILLIPGKLDNILGGIRPTTLPVLGFSMFLVSLANESSLAFKYDLGKRRTVHILTAISLGTLATIFLGSKYFLEALIPIVLALGHLYFSVNPESESDQRLDFFVLGISGVNLLAGIFLVLPTIFSKWPFKFGYPLDFFIGGIFLVTALAGGITSIQKKHPGKKSTQKFLAIPWLFSALIAFAQANTSGLLLFLGFAITPLLADEIPWERLVLPKEDILGRRAFRAAGIAELLMLASLTILGNNFPILASRSNILSQENVSFGSHEVSFLAMLTTKAFLLYGLVIIILVINSLAHQLGQAESQTDLELQDSPYLGWSKWIARSLKPFSFSTQSLRTRLEIQNEQIAALNHQIEKEKWRNAQLNLLTELSQQLEAQLDHPVAAQLTVNTLQRALNCTEVTIYENEVERREFSVMASAGGYLPSGYRQSTGKGLLGRALRLRKTQIANDTSLDPDFIEIENTETRSAIAIPLIDHGHVKAVLEVGSDKLHAFTSSDVNLAEMAIGELIRAWERSSYHQRLTKLIQAGVSLSPLLEPQATIQEIASIARDTLQARFTFVILLDQEGKFSRTTHSGNAPKLLRSLLRDPSQDATIQAALHAYEAFRVRDVRKFDQTANLLVDHNGLRCMLAIPIRVHRLSIGAILTFGKQGEIFFSENDESLANLLSSQAASAIEATWLYQELRKTLKTTNQLYSLSVEVIRAENLMRAATQIAETGARVANATVAGIVLFNKDMEIEAEVEVDEKGSHPGTQHPMSLIEQALESGETIQFSTEQTTGMICFPLQTPLRKYGVLWMETPNIREYYSRHASNMQTLANQAAVALERSILLVESQEQAKAIEAAYQELEKAYDRTLAALMSALDARDRETEGHSARVSLLACKLGEAMGLSADQMKVLERGSLLHDIGKIGISDTILHKPGSLDKAEWEIMHTHPDIGAHIVEEIPFLQETIPIIRYHQERWDGSGYPDGLAGVDIPALARIFAIADAFDALISDRPYRKRVSISQALDYLREQAGVLFDPDMVSTFIDLVNHNNLEGLG